MSPDPYRTPSPSPAQPRAAVSMEIAVAAGIAWALAVMRVTYALLRADAPSHEIDVAWLIVIVAPIVVWKEIAARREQRG